VATRIATNAPPPAPVLENGISYRCSKVTLADVLDGSTHTLAVGEKFLGGYDGTNTVDNENMYVGYVNDLYRSTHVNFFPPRRDIPGSALQLFGSAHANAFNGAFCDGSVRPINYRVAQGVYAKLGNRKDGQVISPGSY
jgi:prepilin-type processing-associated H-X9-DG protein